MTPGPAPEPTSAPIFSLPTVKPGPDPAEAEYPYVKVITDTQGEAIDDGREIDLREKDENGEYRHYIIRLIDNTEHKFDTSRYFV